MVGVGVRVAVRVVEGTERNAGGPGVPRRGILPLITKANNSSRPTVAVASTAYNRSASMARYMPSTTVQVHGPSVQVNRAVMYRHGEAINRYP